MLFPEIVILSRIGSNFRNLLDAIWVSIFCQIWQYVVTVRVWGALQYVLLSMIHLGGLWLVLYVINKVGSVAHQLHFALLLLRYKMVFHASIDRLILFHMLILYREIDVLVSKFNSVWLYGPCSLSIGHNGLWSVITITSGAPTR